MIRLALIAWLTLCGVAHAQLSGGAGGFPGPGTVHSSGFTPSCAQSTSFLARASAITSNTDKTNYDNLICGLETDGVGCSNTLDVLYILAAPDSATYLLNLCSASFTLTVTGTGTFTASQGWAGNGSTGFLNTGYDPSAGTFGGTLNSQMGVYIRTSRGANANTIAMGANRSAGASFLYIQPLNGGNIGWSVNGSAAGFPTAANTNVQGTWAASRVSSSTNTNLYKNGNATAFAGPTNNPNTNMMNVSVYIGATNNIGTAAQFSTDQIAAAWYGAGTNGTGVAAIQNRINTFMTAYGTNVY